MASTHNIDMPPKHLPIKPGRVPEQLSMEQEDLPRNQVGYTKYLRKNICPTADSQNISVGNHGMSQEETTNLTQETHSSAL